jgi:phosphoribosylanthranilate isomerase
MRRTRIKICGIMRPEDAALAAQLGADAIGIVLHRASVRNVPLKIARSIISALPPFVTPVGVFVDASPSEVLEVAGEIGLATVQLNGDQGVDEVAQLRGLRVIKAIRVVRDELATSIAQWASAIDGGTLSNLLGLVLEPGRTGQPGGTGIANDWDEVRAAQTAGAFKSLPPLIAAGGLKSDTVGDVVRSIRPFAVDVSSGVEERIGIKSPEKMRTFIDAVRSADRQNES